MIAAKRVGVLLALGAEVVEIDRPVVQAATTTTRMPAMTADAAFVPCALEGMRQTSRRASPRDRW